MSKFEDDIERHIAASHAMQSGVAMKMNYDPSETQPKHLRVGVNVAMRDHSALARLLIQRGIISEDEYAAAIADEMEEEKRLYEQWLTERLKTPITLG